ncbi:MAG: hypothetical protein CYPHOPRED_000020 [Cyphobasidiales sp. Tagirdzhanova-0007]|nr:MAG: hypothetical protein CYPHOPRED_000020 [Cyphobasidiales sp. Tagirdzhanova-0007]
MNTEPPFTASAFASTKGISMHQRAEGAGVTASSEASPDFQLLGLPMALHTFASRSASANPFTFFDFAEEIPSADFEFPSLEVAQQPSLAQLQGRPDDAGWPSIIF